MHILMLASGVLWGVLAVAILAGRSRHRLRLSLGAYGLAWIGTQINPGGAWTILFVLAPALCGLSLLVPHHWLDRARTLAMPQWN